MPELIYEAVVTTCSPDGAVHVAPMGVRYVEQDVVLMPFRPSTTLSNILATQSAVLNLVTDVRLFAGCVAAPWLGRREWPVVDVTSAAPPARAVRLAAALGHVALRLVDVRDDEQRPVLRLARGEAAQHGPFAGMNRAQAAVLEAAVLVSRLHLLPAAKIDSEMAYLQIAIDKTAGPDELEAWGWLQAAIAAQRAAAGTPRKD